MPSKVQLIYGLRPDGEMLHISQAANGLSCQCVCPGCGAPLVARNAGAYMHPHYAHYSGTACEGAHESELHLLAKQILADEKALMLPAYGKVYAGGLQHFLRMEVEERNDYTMLQPDVVGVQLHPKTGEESRLWIEIKVTHEVDEAKRQKIGELRVACVEVDLGLFEEQEVTRETLRQFLLESKEYRRWINNPVLASRLQQQVEDRKAYAERKMTERMQRYNAQPSDMPDIKVSEEESLYIHLHSHEALVFYHHCARCAFHTTRQSLLREVAMQKFPASVRDLLLKGDLSWWMQCVASPVPTRPTDYLLTIGNHFLYLPTQSPDMHGQRVPAARLLLNRRIIDYFLHDVPLHVTSMGTKCQHCTRFFQSPDGRHKVSCKCPEVVTKTRKSSK